MSSTTPPRGGLVNPGWFAIAVQTLVVLSRSGETCPSTMLAGQVGAHAVFLRRLLALLGRAHLIEAHEGREGGYRLAQAPEQITLATIYRALQQEGGDGFIPLEPARGPALEPGLRWTFAEIGREFEASALSILERYTLADVLARAEQVKDLPPDAWACHPDENCT
jgi:Rrf2 family transcriptional repressor of oqxAB